MHETTVAPTSVAYSAQPHQAPAEHPANKPPEEFITRLFVTLHRKISHNAGEEFLELARAGHSTFNQLSFGTKISFIPGSVPELRHFEVAEVKKSTMEKRSKTLIITWVGVN